MKLQVEVLGSTRANVQGIDRFTKSQYEFPRTGASHRNDSAVISEVAGRACYQSWSKPNPDTATLEGYLGHVMDQKHLSVLEHGSVTFGINGVSRSLTHELIRHRHGSYSELSQRFVNIKSDHNEVDESTELRWDASPTSVSQQFITPPLYAANRSGYNYAPVLEEAWLFAVRAYNELVTVGEEDLKAQGVEGKARRKQAREAARCVLPNMTPTSIVMSANHRAWLEFLYKRATEHADREICALAMAIYHLLADLEPTIYQHCMPWDDPTGRTTLVWKD